MARRPWRFWPRSLRWQLQAWQAFLSTCMLVAFGVAVYELVDAHRFRQVDTDLQDRVGALRRIISDARNQGLPDLRDGELPPRFLPRRADDGTRPPWPPNSPPLIPGHLPRDLTIPPATAALFDSPSGYYFVIWSRDGTLLRNSLNAPEASPKPTALERDSLPHVRVWASYREIIHCSGVGDCIVAGRSVAGELRNATAIAWLLPLAGGTVLLIGLAIGSWLITNAVRPLEQIETTAAQISAGKLAARVPVSDPDNELGQLSAVLNATFARLEAAFERQEQFTSDAAHELRTPLAILISEAQTSLARPRSAAEYKQALEDCLDTAQQMRRLTDSLLDLARLDMGHASAQRSEIDLADVALQCVSKLQPVASRHGVTLKQDLSCARVVNLAERMMLVVMNLLLNAISYNRPGGEVLVTTQNEGGYATLSVADTGIGIEPAHLPHIFDRFYRADKARSRDVGHAGLGLSICKAILDAENGSIQVQSEIGKGTVFTVCFPVASS